MPKRTHLQPKRFVVAERSGAHRHRRCPTGPQTPAPRRSPRHASLDWTASTYQLRRDALRCRVRPFRQPRAEAGATGPGVDRLLIVLRRRADPSPTGTPIRGRARCERTTAADASRHAIGLLDIGARGRRHGRPQPSSRRPVEPGATTSSACRLHGLLPASPRGPHEVRHARRPHTLQEETPRPAPPRRPERASFESRLRRSLVGQGERNRTPRITPGRSGWSRG
jgi:hypothetical protein